VVYIYAFDVAYEMIRQPVGELLGQPVAQFAVDASKRSLATCSSTARKWSACRRLERIGPGGPMRVERGIKLLPVGAISITMRVPFEVRRIEDLVGYHDLQFSSGSLTTKSAGSPRRCGASSSRTTFVRCRSLPTRKPTQSSASNRRRRMGTVRG